MNNVLWPILGGVFIGLSAVMLLFLSGRIAGISGIVWGAVSQKNSPDIVWRGLFIVGVLLGAFLLHLLSGKPTPFVDDDYPLAAIAGLLVGMGVKLGNGCTSGHGVCGIGRLSTRSIVSTIIFMVVAVATVLLSNLDVLWGAL
jgi:uncharacterized membrane protein YedE/YeeE